MARVRSPNYPALSLLDAIERVREVHQKQQTTPEPRPVVIKHMGYNSVNGRALKALSALIKYGLLEEAGTGLRVSGRAIAILFPDPANPSAKAEAITAAAKEPELFARIVAQKGAKPSPDSLRHFLIHEGFNMNAVEQVARSFYATLELVESQDAEYDSSGTGDEEEEMQQEPQGAGNAHPAVLRGEKNALGGAGLNSTKPVFDFETVAINTKIDNKDDLAELIERLEKLKGMLPNKTQH